ncbi:sulfurtransferase [Streptosporangium sp. NPDC020072]|uniref:sulfurtransferase n=1 Tax=Streptosporangium sp. NPDC020072 TaxID=3154788 RepID=UPI00343744A1
MERESVLVSAEWAQNHLETPGVVFVDTGNDDVRYLKSHVPGAVWVGWDEFQDDLRLGVVGQERFEELMSAKGIGDDDTVVVYSSNANLLAALTYWYFKLYGHRDVRMLDGGFDKWERDGRRLGSAAPVRPATSYRAQPPDMSVRATRDDVIAAIGRKNIVDVRTPEEYSGEIFAPGFAGEAFAPGNNPHEVAQRSGHVPGAVNIPWETVTTADGSFRPAAELADLYGGLDPDAGAITYCWVGARSAHTWFVLSELLGMTDVKNYDGSWAEYGSLIGVPVERGPGIE